MHKPMTSRPSRPSSLDSGSIQSRSSESIECSAKASIKSFVSSIISAGSTTTISEALESSTPSTPLSPVQSFIDLSIRSHEIEKFSETRHEVPDQATTDQNHTRANSVLQGHLRQQRDITSEQRIEPAPQLRRSIPIEPKYTDASDANEIRREAWIFAAPSQEQRLQLISDESNASLPRTLSSLGNATSPYDTGNAKSEYATSTKPVNRVRSYTLSPKLRRMSRASLQRQPVPKKSIGTRICKFLCVSANPDDDSSIVIMPSTPTVQRTPSASASKHAVMPSSQSKDAHRSTQTRRQDGKTKVHTSGSREIYVPKYTDQAHSLTTTGRTHIKERKAVAKAQLPKKMTDHIRGSWDGTMNPSNDLTPKHFVPVWAPASRADTCTGLSSLQSHYPVALKRPSSRKRSSSPHPDRTRAEIQELNKSNSLKGHTSIHGHCSSLKFSPFGDIIQSACNSTITTKDHDINPLQSSRSTSQYKPPRTNPFVANLPLVKQTIEEEQTSIESEEVRRRIRRAKCNASLKRHELKAAQEEKQLQVLKSLEDTAQQESKLETMLEKLSFGWYKSELTKSIERIEKDISLQNAGDGREALKHVREKRISGRPKWCSAKQRIIEK